MAAGGRSIHRPLAMSREDFLREYGSVFAHFTGRDDVTLARPDLVQCDDATCPYVVAGHSLFSDANHMTVTAVERFRGIFTETLNR